MSRKIAYMHIAKTAGSSVNHYFEALFGTDACRTFAEHDISAGENLSRLTERYDYVSGHLFYGHFASLPQDVFTFTTVRNPYAQLASHILWLDRYNRPALREQRDALPREVRDLISLIGTKDVGNVFHLDELLTHLPPYGVYLFNNLQSRYLVGDSANMDPLSLNDGTYVIAHLQKFDAYCSLDAIGSSIPRIAAAAGHAAGPFAAYENRAEHVSAIDIENPLVQKVLQKHLLVDLMVYEHVLAAEEAAYR